MTRRFSRALLALMLLLATLSSVSFLPCADAFSWPRKAIKTASSSSSQPPRIVGADSASVAVKALMEIVSDMNAASNQHDIAALLKHYSPEFVSGDNLSLSEVRSLIEDTWKTYPDIRYESTPLEIRINGDWATIESLDTAKATVSNKEGVINEPGDLSSQSRGMMFLRHIGNLWEITSDHTLYENAVIRFGAAKTLNASLSAPDQAFAGESYAAKIALEMPSSLIAIASISKDPIVFPQRMPDDRFRSLSPENNELERVFAANKANRNEVVTASIGLTQIGQDADDRLTVQFRGVMMIIRRVNVLPKASKWLDSSSEALVDYAANGRVDLRKKTDAQAGPAPEEMTPSADAKSSDEKSEPSPDVSAPPASPPASQSPQP
ncbi:MAG: nuclear transport factor 2 family protein [Vampirovibrionales bacterium]|nr:nuclear transport factor 2 family protein [Vampirovibrionales bacterium]